MAGLPYKLDQRADISAAQAAGPSPDMDAAALRVKARILAIAAPHNKSGGYMESIKIERATDVKGVMDRVIYSDHPEAEKIEWGHEMVANGKIRPDLPAGTPLGWVKGLYIFTRARGSM